MQDCFKWRKKCSQGSDKWFQNGMSDFTNESLETCIVKFTIVSLGPHYLFDLYPAF